MAENETSLALLNGSLTSQAIGAAIGGLSLARKAAPTPTPIALQRYSLSFLIAAVKKADRKRTLPQNE